MTLIRASQVLEATKARPMIRPMLLPPAADAKTVFPVIHVKRGTTPMHSRPVHALGSSRLITAAAPGPTAKCLSPSTALQRFSATHWPALA